MWNLCRNQQSSQVLIPLACLWIKRRRLQRKVQWMGNHSIQKYSYLMLLRHLNYTCMNYSEKNHWTSKSVFIFIVMMFHVNLLLSMCLNRLRYIASRICCIWIITAVDPVYCYCCRILGWPHHQAFKLLVICMAIPLVDCLNGDCARFQMVQSHYSVGEGWLIFLLPSTFKTMLLFILSLCIISWSLHS